MESDPKESEAWLTRGLGLLAWRCAPMAAQAGGLAQSMQQVRWLFFNAQVTLERMSAAEAQSTYRGAPAGVSLTVIPAVPVTACWIASAHSNLDALDVLGSTVLAEGATYSADTACYSSLILPA